MGQSRPPPPAPPSRGAGGGAGVAPPTPEAVPALSRAPAFAQSEAPRRLGCAGAAPPQPWDRYSVGDTPWYFLNILLK